MVRGLAKTIVFLAPLLAAIFGPRAISAYTGEPETPLPEFYLTHIGYFGVLAVPPLACVAYVVINARRVSPPKDAKGKPKRPPRPALPSLGQRVRDTINIIAILDNIIFRFAYVAVFAAGTVMAGHFYPVTIDMFKALPDDPDILQKIFLGIIGPIGAYGLIYLRISSVIRSRTEQIESVYAIARDTLDYPKRLPATLTKRQRHLMTPWQAIQVKTWRSLHEIDRFFVLAPEELSIEDVKTWDEFTANLNAKHPRTEEWRLQRDPRGRGGDVGPANYPTAVLWDGEIDPDPLTFLLGQNLETGKTQTLTFGEVSPHLLVTGGTSSGKTSMAEIVAAQVLVKPMPWDPMLHGMVVIVDPKGPFARRWAGRPGVVVANGQMDGHEVDDDGDPISGITVMAACMQWLEEEHQRRALVLARYSDLGTWIDMPEEVKKAERFFPIFVILDEYLDHVESEKAAGNKRIETENAAREIITRLTGWHARKYRNVGMHTCLIAQRANMKLIGSQLVTNLAVRAITGQMDPSQTQSMFVTSEVPNLPSARVVIENGERKVKTIPGRARIMNALGQSIEKIQVMWFGGSSNTKTLEKWLPRGEVPPNGNFSVPQGMPRTPADFDSNGNFVGMPNAEKPSTDEDLPMDGVEPSAGDFDTTRLPEGFEDDSIEGKAGATPLSSGNDPDAVFPAASRSETRCAHPVCVEDATSTCSTCKKPVCPEHTHVPYCTDDAYLAGTPLAGLVESVRAQIEGSDVAARWRVEGDVEGPEHAVLVVTTSAGKKVAEARITNGQLQARTKSGTSDGSRPATERVNKAIKAYFDASPTKADDEQPDPPGESEPTNNSLVVASSEGVSDDVDLIPDLEEGRS